jgi:hypothetical protein
MDWEHGCRRDKKDVGKVGGKGGRGGHVEGLIRMFIER